MVGAPWVLPDGKWPTTRSIDDDRRRRHDHPNSNPVAPPKGTPPGIVLVPSSPRTSQVRVLLGAQKKLGVIKDLADVLQAASIETTSDLAAAYADDQAAAALTSSLRKVNGVGSKTIDYLAILVGSDQHVAVDQHLRAVAQEAGVTNRSYSELRGLYTAVARHRGWTPGELDRAVWLHRRQRNS
jgi:hypothetical protein